MAIATKEALAIAPLSLGILTLYLKNKRMEERVFFQRLIARAHSLHIDAYVFDPEDVHTSPPKVRANVYEIARQKWVRMWKPLPQLVFDRCRLQHHPKFKKVTAFRQAHPELQWLNRPLGNKWTVYRRLVGDPLIRPHLPETVLYTDFASVARFSQRHPRVFVKPIHGTGGRGVVCLQRKKDTRSYHIWGRDQARKHVHHVSASPQETIRLLTAIERGAPCVVQQGIDVTLPDGRVHDFRLLMQKNDQGAWGVTGCAGRIGAIESITSNLHGGGQAIVAETLLKKKGHPPRMCTRILTEMETLGSRIVRRLDRKTHTLCELALDIAVDPQGKSWLLEVNPKPSRDIFRRIHAMPVYTQSIDYLLGYAKWKIQQQTSFKETHA